MVVGAQNKKIDKTGEIRLTRKPGATGAKGKQSETPKKVQNVGHGKTVVPWLVGGTKKFEKERHTTKRKSWLEIKTTNF